MLFSKIYWVHPGCSGYLRNYDETIGLRSQVRMSINSASSYEIENATMQPHLVHFLQASIEGYPKRDRPCSSDP